MEEDNNITPFHEGDLKRNRKDLIKREILELNKFPLQQLGGGLFNFNLIFEGLNNLVLEIGKNNISENEQKICESLKELIELTMENNPVYSKITNSALAKANLKYNENNWKTLKKRLYDYNSFVFSLDDKHSADTKGNIEQKES